MSHSFKYWLICIILADTYWFFKNLMQLSMVAISHLYCMFIWSNGKTNSLFFFSSNKITAIQPIWTISPICLINHVINNVLNASERHWSSACFFNLLLPLHFFSLKWYKRITWNIYKKKKKKRKNKKSSGLKAFWDKNWNEKKQTCPINIHSGSSTCRLLSLAMMTKSSKLLLAAKSWWWLSHEFLNWQDWLLSLMHSLFQLYQMCSEARLLYLFDLAQVSLDPICMHVFICCKKVL